MQVNTRTVYINGEAKEVSVEEYERLRQEAISQVNYWPTMPYDHYRSTACQHAIHDKCRLVCKYCFETCNCSCHSEVEEDAGK